MAGNAFMRRCSQWFLKHRQTDGFVPKEAPRRVSAGKAADFIRQRFQPSTQAAWRFFGNESVSLSVLQEPLTAAAHEGIASHCSQYALCVHDWSHLNYKHLNKTDTYAITHETDVG